MCISIYNVCCDLQKQNNSALDGFEELAVKCAHLKECKLIAYYEIGVILILLLFYYCPVLMQVKISYCIIILLYYYW